MKLLVFLYPSLLFLAVSSSPAPPRAQVPLSARPHPGHLPAILMPPNSNSGSGSGSGSNNPQVQRAVPLADILGTHRSLTTFSSFARLHESTTRILSDAYANCTVLAPLNSAIDALPRKPWEDPRDYAALGSQAYDGSGGKDRADQNLRRLVEAHLVVAPTPWPEGVKVTTAGGRQVWWETETKDGGGRRLIMPDKVEVDRVASQVANGEVWFLKGVLNSA